MPKSPFRGIARVVLACVLSVLLGVVPVRAQSVKVALTTDSSALSATVAYPNTEWTETAYENNASYPADDDWTLADATITFYVVPEPGASFGTVDLTVQWDEAKLALVEAEAGNAPNGLFAGSDATFESDTLGDASSVRVNASRLDNENVTAQSGDYIARLTFTLEAPGEAALDLTSLDLRAYDGAGGQSDVSATATDGAVVAYLGDVASPDDETTGDGVVDFEDYIVLSMGYPAGTSSVNESLDTYKAKLDIGPTLSGNGSSLPQHDQAINFEDIIIFSISYQGSGSLK